MESNSIEITALSELDFEGKSYVHYVSWKETYEEIMPKAYLDSHTLESCLAMTERYQKNTIVAKIGTKVVGFADKFIYTTSEMTQEAEINAIYVLKDYQKMGIGKLLMNSCLNSFPKGTKVILWVAKGNDTAIAFYQRCGFTTDNMIKKMNVGSSETIEIVRMSHIIDMSK